MDKDLDKDRQRSRQRSKQRWTRPNVDDLHMLPVWVWRVTCLGEVSTGWAPTTSEKRIYVVFHYFIIWHLQQVRMQESYWLSYYRSLVAGMDMGRRISWACGSFLLMVGLRRSRRRRPRLGSGKRLFWEGNTLFQILSPTPSTVVHTENNNLFFALRGAGSSYGVVTQFK